MADPGERLEDAVLEVLHVGEQEGGVKAEDDDPVAEGRHPPVPARVAVVVGAGQVGEDVPIIAYDYHTYNF